jgi:hypothetical protein
MGLPPIPALSRIRRFMSKEQIVAECTKLEQRSLVLPLRAFGLVDGRILTPQSQVILNTGHVIYVVSESQLNEQVTLINKEFKIQYITSADGKPGIIVG